MSKVNIDYSDFNSNIINRISMSLFRDILFEIIVKDLDKKTLTLSMNDKVSSNVEVSGDINLDDLNSLLKSLNTIKKQFERSE